MRSLHIHAAWPGRIGVPGALNVTHSLVLIDLLEFDSSDFLDCLLLFLGNSVCKVVRELVTHILPKQKVLF